jgi:hypothetical protein
MQYTSAARETCLCNGCGVSWSCQAQATAYITIRKGPVLWKRNHLGRDKDAEHSRATVGSQSKNRWLLIYLFNVVLRYWFEFDLLHVEHRFLCREVVVFSGTLILAFDNQSRVVSKLRSFISREWYQKLQTWLWLHDCTLRHLIRILCDLPVLYAVELTTKSSAPPWKVHKGDPTRVCVWDLQGRSGTNVPDWIIPAVTATGPAVRAARAPHS